MTLALPIATVERPEYAVPENALRRWVAERLQHRKRSDGATVYTFALSGSTCTNQPLDVVMSVVVTADGRIESTSASPAPNDIGCDVMCASGGGGGRAFLTHVGACREAAGMTLEQAAFHPWNLEPSGCFCSAGNRLHKWRNVFQAIHFARAGLS